MTSANKPCIPEVSIYKIRPWVMKHRGPMYKAINSLSFNEHPAILHYLVNVARIYDGDLNWYGVCANPSMVPLIKANIDNSELIKWNAISKNPSPEVIPILEKNIEKLAWFNICRNPAAMSILKQYPEKIDWAYVCENPADAALDLIEKNEEMINWTNLSRNTNPRAIRLLEKNPQNINWYCLSLNPAAIDILKKHPDKIVWECLSENSSPEAIELLKQNPERINWEVLTCNPAAIELLEQNQKNIPDWNCLLINPAIFELDYEFMRNSREALNKEIIMWFYSPKQITKLLETEEGEDLLFNY